MRELSNIFKESAKINLDSLNTDAKSSNSNTSKLNISRDIRDSTRAMRVPIVRENTKRLSTSVDKKLLIAGSSTPQDRASSKVRRVSMSDSLTSTKTDNVASRDLKSKSSSTISDDAALVTEASAISVAAAADTGGVSNNVAGVSDDVAGVDDVANVIAAGDIVDIAPAHVANDVDCPASEVVMPVARNKKHKQLIGENTDAEMFASLPSVPRHRFLHISRLNKSGTEENVINYIARKLDLPTTSLVCHKLIKKEADMSSLHYINFKLGIPTALFNDALQSSIWPVGVQIKKFEYRSKNASNSSPQVLT